MTNFDDLKAAVAEIRSARESVLTLIGNLASRVAALAAAPVSQSDIDTLVASLHADKEALADAVVHNTIAQDEPAPAAVEAAVDPVAA
jgi:hypothetical protein